MERTGDGLVGRCEATAGHRAIAGEFDQHLVAAAHHIERRGQVAVESELVPPTPYMYLSWQFVHREEVLSSRCQERVGLLVSIVDVDEIVIRLGVVPIERQPHRHSRGHVDLVAAVGVVGVAARREARTFDGA